MADAYEGLVGDFATRLRRLIDASGGRIKIRSGFRSKEHQERLWKRAIAKYGSEKAARKWVAPPGKSNHNHGMAVDLGGDLKLAAKLAPKFGLHFPMAHEPWHIEPLGSRGSADSYTTTPDEADGLDKFMAALSGQESGGNYQARNARTGAYGRFQIMPGNWNAWAREAGLAAGAQQTPANQERVARFKLGQYYEKFGSWDAVAVAWYAGPGAAQAWVKDRNTSRFMRKQGKGNEPSINEYAASVIRRMGTTRAAAGTPDIAPDSGPDGTPWGRQLGALDAFLSSTEAFSEPEPHDDHEDHDIDTPWWRRTVTSSW